ncbi:MAG: ADP-forming succinate--CoA ligase subunit beta [Chloroflexota bacterium]|nr:ADP-forming succinate--CoA ligase subunit beta [Chloroflexota bacterium]
MKLLEFEAKGFFRKAGIPVPEGVVAQTAEEARKAYSDLGGNVVLKSQVLVGGRGKAGGIKFPKSEKEAYEMAGQLFRMQIKGVPVEKILVEKALDIKREYYLGIITDPDEGCPLLMFSAEGGMEIEDLASQKPAAIKRVLIDPRYGLFGYQLQFELQEAGLPKELHNGIINVARRLYQTYWDMDGELIEINPLVVTNEGKVVAADAKFNIDNSGLPRHPELPKRPAKNIEERAAELGLSYVLLDGNIGIISNGAGLTMAAMDFMREYGSSPANFLDLGGQATQAVTIKNGIKIVLENHNVTALLIYIFAGGPRCDVIASGIIEALDEMEKEKSLRVPIVATLHGRYNKEGMKILSASKSPYLHLEAEVEDAVHKVIELGGQ